MAGKKVDILTTILDSIQRCSAPIWASESIAALPLTVDHNGTCGFVDTGTRRLVLTAAHVVDKYHELKTRHPAAVLAINLGAGCTVALTEPDVIDSDAEFDIASIGFPQLDQQSTPHDKMYFPARTWPIPRAKAGDLVAFVGFPGERRRTTAAWGSFEPIGAGFIVSSASDRNIVLADESGTMSFETSPGAQMSTVRLGGFSGTPVFLVEPGGPQIIGVLRAGSESIGRGAGNTVFLTPTYFLKPDGTFDRSAMP
jgi:Trypsin-like peptidase domain